MRLGLPLWCERLVGQGDQLSIVVVINSQRLKVSVPQQPDDLNREGLPSDDAFRAAQDDPIRKEVAELAHVCPLPYGLLQRNKG